MKNTQQQHSASCFALLVLLNNWMEMICALKLVVESFAIKVDFRWKNLICISWKSRQFVAGSGDQEIEKKLVNFNEEMQNEIPSHH